VIKDSPTSFVSIKVYLYSLYPKMESSILVYLYTPKQKDRFNELISRIKTKTKKTLQKFFLEDSYPSTGNIILVLDILN